MGAILQYGLSVALVGIATVFVGLIILIGLIKLMEMIMTGGKGKKKAEAPAPAAAPAPVAEEAVEETDDDELIAVIAAAVAAAMEQAGDGVCRALHPPHQQRARVEPRRTRGAGLQPHVIGAASLNIQFCEEDLHYA
mgnify:CR=1 FL=1